MGRKYTWLTLTATQCKEIEDVSIKSGWQRLSQESLPSVLPLEFRKKIDSAVIIAAPTSTGGTYLVYNNMRVDQKANAIDQEPFALIVHSTGPSPNGLLIHHGNWKGRTTTDVPKEFWDHVNESGVGNYFYANPPSGISSGALNELPPGDREAFNRAINRIRAEADKK